MAKKKTAMRLVGGRGTAKTPKWSKEVVAARAKIDSLRENFGIDREELLGLLTGYWHGSEGEWECSPAEAAYITGLSVDEVKDFYEWWPKREHAYCFTTEFAEYRKYKQGLHQWSIGELMQHGVNPCNDSHRQRAVARVENEAVPLNEVCDIMQEIGDRSVSITDIVSQLEAGGVQCAMVREYVPSRVSGINYQNIVSGFDFSNPTLKPFVEPAGLGVLEKKPEYAGLKKHSRWKQLKKRFATHGGGAT